MNVEVKWGVITLVKQTMDLCDQIENVDLKCPLEKGNMVLTKQVDLPKQIPPVSLPIIEAVYILEILTITLPGSLLCARRCLH